MKNVFVLISRTGLILLAAVVVVLITMRVVDSNGASQLPSAPQNEFAQSSAVVANAGAPAAQASGREFRGERHGPRNQSLTSHLTFGLFGLAKNFAIIGVVALIVVGIERFFTRRFSRAAV